MRVIAVLHALCACEGEAISWVMSRSPRADLGLAAKRMWHECERGDWLIWLITHEFIRSHLSDADRRLRLIACDCADTILSVYEREYPGDMRPRHSIEIARRFAMGDATEEKLSVAWNAASDAASDAAGDAAWAATKAASAAAWAATKAAAKAARATASDASAAARREQADIVRRYYRWSDVRGAIEAAGLS